MWCNWEEYMNLSDVEYVLDRLDDTRSSLRRDIEILEDCIEDLKRRLLFVVLSSVFTALSLALNGM